MSKLKLELVYNEDTLIAKQCSKCLTIKNITNFGKLASHKTGFDVCCKNCRSIKSKTYYIKNQQKIKNYIKEYSIKNKDLILSKKREYNKKRHKKKIKDSEYSAKRNTQAKEWRLRNSQKVKNYNKKYKIKNKELCESIRGRRVSSKRSSSKIKLSELYMKVRKLNKEAKCIKFHIDHIIPLQHELVCGLHVPANLQILTAKENSSKRNKFDGTYENESWRQDL
jgi:hypothetical protein